MKVTLKIEGMMCMHCVAHVKKALSEIDGVSNVEVSLEKNEAEVEMSKPIDHQIFVNAIQEAGYEVKE